jgi:uncharacterized membrane protein (DUF2068 family)
MATQKRHRALAWIAIFKLSKAAALVILAAAIFHLLRPGALDRTAETLAHIPLASGWKPLLHLLDWLVQLSPHNIVVVGTVACAYALLYTVEGIGLWLQKRWAEYLTTIATASLIPFEIWEITRGISALKIAALIVNIAIVIYLCSVLRSDRAHQ